MGESRCGKNTRFEIQNAPQQSWRLNDKENPKNKPFDLVRFCSPQVAHFDKLSASRAGLSVYSEQATDGPLKEMIEENRSRVPGQRIAGAGEHGMTGGISNTRYSMLDTRYRSAGRKSSFHHPHPNQIWNRAEFTPPHPGPLRLHRLKSLRRMG